MYLGIQTYNKKKTRFVTSKRTPCITRRLLYTEWGTVLFTLKWLSANLERWPSFNQAEQFKQPGFTQRNHLIFDVKHDYRITVRNGRLFVQVASGAVIFKWYICLPENDVAEHRRCIVAKALCTRSSTKVQIVDMLALKRSMHAAIYLS